jgi:hypothetical protein
MSLAKTRPGAGLSSRRMLEQFVAEIQFVEAE